MKKLYLLCGGNGAGKTTFYRLNLEPEGIGFVNADEEAKKIHHASGAVRDALAWQSAIQIRDRKLHRGESFAYETVFSHPSKLELIDVARGMGYEVLLFYIFLDSPELHEKRVKLGFQQSLRHDVPTEKILSRLPRIAEYVPQAIARVDDAAIYNNSDGNNPFRLVGRFRKGIVDPAVPLDVPEWLRLPIDGSKRM